MTRNHRIFSIFIFLVTAVFITSFYFQEKAQAIGEPYNLGDLSFITDAGADVFDASNAYSQLSKSLSNPSSDMGPLFDPDGNLYLPSLALGDANFRCYTKASNYTLACENPLIDYIEAYNQNFGLPKDAFMDNEKNIWLTLYYDTTFNPNGHQIIKMPFASDYEYSSWKVYEVTGHTCSNPIYNNDYTACDANGGNMSGGTKKTPIQSVMDYNGDIWVVHYGDTAAPSGTKVTCLDADNNYNYCQGTFFEDNKGTVTIGSYPFDIAVDRDNNLWVTIVRNSDILKITTDVGGYNNYATTSYSLGALYGGDNEFIGLDADTNGRLWISEAKTGVVNCYDPITASNCAEVIIYNNAQASDSIVDVKLDKNGDIWAVDARNKLLVSVDTSNSYATTSYSPSVGTQYFSYGDETGYEIYNLCTYLGGCFNEMNIYGTVDPLLSFEIIEYDNLTTETSVCDIGTLTAGQVASCQYRVGVGTNGTTGFQVYIEDISTYPGLTANSGSDIINDVTDSSVDGSGSSEEYGLLISNKATGISADGTFDSVEQAVPISETEFINTVNPNEYIRGTSSHSTSVQHKAVIDASTPAGYYTQVLQYKIVANY